MKGTFFIETYGCQMNVSDSELVTSILINAGWKTAKNIDNADLLLFNTCSVRQHAEDRVLGRIANEKSRKQNKPNLKIGVLGCMAQRMGKRLKEIESGVDYVVGVDQYHLLPFMLEEEIPLNVSFDYTQIYPGIPPAHSNKTNAFITIMRGCNNYCTYCIVPYVRGRERSVSMDDILNEAKKCVEQGLREITLLGQNVNSYEYNNIHFPELLNELCNIEGLYRLRFITSHPKDLSDQLIEVMARQPKICNHIHLPLQSGDNSVLLAMNRKYTIEYYTNLIDKLRNAIPDIAITTDLIAGFPGENETCFANTLTAMQNILFDYAFCFKYSERSGTKAAEYTNQIPESVRLKRLQTMIDLQRDITLQKFRNQIGNTVEVYVENISRKSSQQVSGKTRDYKIAVLPGSQLDIGTLRSATVKDATSGTLICR